MLDLAKADLRHGRRRAAARRLLALCDDPANAAEAASLLTGLAEPPHGAALAERLRFGPPETWAGWHPGHGRVAVKLGAVVAPAAFRHPGVAPPLAWGAGWAVHAWIAGKTLAAAPPADPARVLAEVAAAVAALHCAGLAHGDLTPANVVVQPGGGAVLIDWGEETAGTPGWRPQGPATPAQRDSFGLDRLRDHLGLPPRDVML